MNVFNSKLIGLLCITMCCNVQAQLVITAVYDGPLNGGHPRGIEIYVSQDIADLSIYGLGSANNGGGTDGEEFTFPNVSATTGDFIYVTEGHPSNPFSDYFGFSPDYTSSAMSINGDDAIELFKDGAVIDVYGDPSVNGTGTAWDYHDGWAYRNNNTGPNGGNFVAANWTFSGTNALDGCNTNASCGSVIPVGTFSLILPVDLLDFRVIKQADFAALSWITASEENNAYFDVQRAGLDMRFESISTVEGQLTTNLVSEYSFKDLNPLAGVNYYRLVQVDVDGTTTVLPTRALNFISDDNIICYPNPASDVLNIQGAKAGATYSVLNVTGLVLKTGFMSSDQIDIDDLPAGMYMLQVQQGVDVIVKSFIKK